MPRKEVIKPRAVLETRFLKYVDKTSSPKGCWLWTGSVRGFGYGYMKIRMPDGKLECQAHRIAFIWWKGPIPPGKLVLHIKSCNTANCINPEHLYAGTQKENMSDKVTLGNAKPNANRNFRKRLSDEQVLQIRAMYSKRKMGHSTIAKMYDTSFSVIQRIVNRKTYKQV